MRGNQTKENILRAARRLFAESGYGATGVDRIAEAVGIKAPSLYKHYAGKEAILLAILEKMREGEDALLDALALSEPFPLDEAPFREAAKAAMARVLADDDLCEERRFLCTLSLGDARVAALRSARRERVLTLAEERLSQMIMARIFKDEDVRVMALQLIAPMESLIALCDVSPEKKREALALCEAHAGAFFRLYRRENDGARERHTPLGRPMPVSLM